MSFGSETTPGGLALKRPVTMRDVARAAGVSHQTVSRVINQGGEISPETRTRVLAAIDELGYQPNYLARSLATSISNTVALVMPRIDNPFFPPIVCGVDDTMAPLGVNLLVLNTGDDADRELRHIEHLRRRRVDGIILCNPRLPTESLRSIGASMRVPLVLINRPMKGPNIGVVRMDQGRAAYQSVSYLHSLGHRRIAFIYVSSTLDGVRESLDAYRAALADLGIADDPSLLRRQPASIAGGEVAAAALLDDGARPTALLCSSDVLAIGALRACSARGLRVPEDVSVMGWGDVQYAAITSPPLTTTRFPLYDLGVNAARLLLAMRSGEGIEPIITLPHTLVERGSCGPPRRPEAALSAFAEAAKRLN